MATYNTTSTSGAASTAGEQFQRTASTTTTFLVPATTTTAPLHLDSFVSAAPHFVGSQPPIAHAHSTQHHPQQHPHQNQHHQQTTNSTSSSYTFVQIKREPCQVSEVSSNQPSTTANGSNHSGVGQATALTSISGAASSSKTMSSSTLTTLVKIEASSPKVHDMDKGNLATLTAAPAFASTNNSVPVGIAVARKRPQESNLSSLGTTTALPVQTLNKDISNCFGIRVADLGGVGTSCGNIFFTGNGELMTGTATADELALNAAGVNRAPSTFWQYPNALPIESVISMSPATVGLQYSREASRGQVVLLPAPATALDPFQQAAAAFVWPSYIPQGAAPAATTLQPPPNFGSNFIFPSMSPHSTLQPQSYATSLQFLGSNYLTAAAAAAAAAAATSTLCQQNQQTNSSTSSINLSLGSGSGALGGSSTSTTSTSSSSSRFLSVTPGTAITAEASCKQQKHQNTTSTLQSLQPQSILVPPSSLKIEEWNATEFMASAAKTTTTTLSAQNHQLVAPLAAAALNFESRDKTTTTTTTTTNLLELQANGLNLMRLPTPPTSATIENAATQVAASSTQLQQQIGLFQSNSPASAVINLTASAAGSLARPAVGASITSNFLNVNTSNHPAASTFTTGIGPPTPHNDEQPTLMKFKTAALEASQSQIVVGVPRVITNGSQHTPGPPPQMQDVNIQTDTPVCSEDENSSCPVAIQQQQQSMANDIPQNLASNVNYYAHASNLQQPLELTKSSSSQSQSHITSHNAIIESSSERQHQLIDSSQASAADAVNGLECHNGNIPPDNSNDAMHPKGIISQAELFKDMKFSDSIMQSVDTTTPVPVAATTNTNSIATSSPTSDNGPEDLTGLELLSNISTSTLVKSNVSSVRIKQEPMEQTIGDFMPKEEFKLATMNGSNLSEKLQGQLVDMATSNGANLLDASSHVNRPGVQNVCRQVDGLSLLCALAEQRIQEEVESSGNLFATSTSTNYEGENSQKHETTVDAVTSHVDSLRCFGQKSPATSYQVDQSSFPSMEGIELPSTSGVSEHPVKRKKRKHSKSSKSSTQEKKKSQKSNKKKQKKYSKEKRKHKLSPKNSDLDDENVQEEWKSALHNMDPNFNQYVNLRSPVELFKIMETDMRMRLADITRQYQKKKRKLEEINKKRKKRKCSKLVAQQQLQQQQQQLQLQQQQLQQQATALALGASLSSVTTGSNNQIQNNCNGLPSTSNVTTSTSLNCDYKFPKFPHSGVSSACPNSTSTSSLLHPSSFLSFKEKSQTHAQFPPPDAGGLSDDNDKSILSASSSIIFKPVRLEPSALTATANSALRLAQKHNGVDKCSSSTSGSSVCKEPKLIASSRLGNDCDVDRKTSNGIGNGGELRGHRKRCNSIDEKLILTSEHLYRKDTRVLTDMGGLFYAGVMNPLQPPDVYAITLDGERGNKPHIMSREEIFKDTILEVTPKSVESVPVGTRLCAYWSQQYRCLYPGRAIGSESSDDGVTTPDFVSVEFDDGDSGRIRLQNIRFLLSDYPIAEYNDNPLYSLGKQKKSSNKSGHSSDAPHIQRQQQQQQHHHILHYDPNPSSASATVSAIDAAGGKNLHHQHQHHTLKHLAQTKNSFAVAQLSDMDATYNNNNNNINNNNNNNNIGEFFARRTEKKRLKSLKKKSQAAVAASLILNGVSTTSSISTTTTGSTATDLVVPNGSMSASAIATTITTTTNATIAVADLSECGRKHHKHKKHKKHKKHHHRKNLIESKDANNSFMLNALSKRGNDTQKQQLIEYAVKHQSRELVNKNAPLLTSTPIKMEVSPIVPLNSNGIKVKSENLDLEEETQSNMLSEISDEVKAEDEIEHNNSKGSKIAAFLPERQLWGWQGKAYRKAGVKGRARKQFYKSIKRGKETITVRDCAVFLSTGRPDRPYIGRIESMWETSSSNKVVRVRWFYHPEETIGCPNLKYPGALFESPHEDENDVQTISHRCEVLPFERYFNKFGADSKQYQSIYDNNDTYYLAGYYNPRLQVLKLEDDIPTLQEENTTIET